jgi:hypothetical protein
MAYEIILKKLFSHELQTHDNFPKDFKIVTGREHSGERGHYYITK